MMLNSVVLPAPFGPIMARRSPGSTDSVTSLRTSSPAKFLQTRSRLSSATSQPVPDADDAAAHEQHEHHEEGAQDQLPAPGEHRRQDVLQHLVNCRAENRADEG